MHRQRDGKGRLVCDGCKVGGFGEWNVAYAGRIGMNEHQIAELRRREAEAIQSIQRSATTEEWTRGYSAGVEAYTRGVKGAPQGYPMMTADFREGWEDGQYDAEEDGVTDGSHPFGHGDSGWHDHGSRTAGAKAGQCAVCGKSIHTTETDSGWRHSEPDRLEDARHPARPIRSRMMGSRKVAHDSGDGEQIYHCPFCGSGAVTGGADGTVSCNYCHQHFTVQVQPEFSSMPQTVNGQPFNIPGMPGGGPDAGAAGQADQAATDDAQEGQPGEPPANEVDPASQDAPPKNPVPPQFQSSLHLAEMALLTPDGVVLDGERYARHLAIRFADPDARPTVIAQVREQNRSA
jgi:ribosomal protein L37AE/L43A